MKVVVVLAFAALCGTDVLGYFVDDEKAIIDDTDVPEYEEYPADDDTIIIEDDIEINTDRNAVSSNQKVWPNGIVPYVFDDLYPDSEKEKIKKGMDELMDNVNTPGKQDCIKFVPYTNQRNYIHVRPRTGLCSSSVGKITRSGKQYVNLGRGCQGTGTVMHEFLHALGFTHEQNHPDRDKYIFVNKTNINVTRQGNFRKNEQARRLGAPYDYESIMHYGIYTMALDKTVPSMDSVRAVDVKIGQGNYMTPIDVVKVQRLYNCSEDTSHIRTLNQTDADKCTFQSGLCSFTNDPDADFNFVIKSGHSASGPPRADASIGTLGKYALAKVRNHKGKKARLISRIYTESKLCVQIHYFNFESTGSIKVQVRKHGPGQAFRTVRTYRGQKKRQWYRLRMSFNKPSYAGSSYQLGFEAQVNDKDIAIDNINIWAGPC